MENINLEKLAGIVKRLPILLVIASAINDREDPETRYIYTQGKRPLTDKEELVDPKESTYLIHCPFHGGGLGSFVITPQKNMWWCFVESEGWSTIDFERKYYDCAGFDDAVIHLAERFNIIRRGQDIHYEEAAVKKLEKTLKKPPADPPGEKLHPEFVSGIYTLMAMVCPLSDRRREHLLTERRLVESDLKDYFDFPSRKTDLAGLIYKKAGSFAAEELFHKPLEELDEREMAAVKDDRRMRMIREKLMYVPGFYRNEETGRTEFVPFDGIGFLVRDHRGLVRGVQVRMDTAMEDGTRYVWFSSRSRSQREGCSGGGSPGTPGGVIWPKRCSRPELVITEGRFKAEAIAKKGKIAVYVSGVGNWKSIRETLRDIKQRYGLKKAYVMFDSDLMGNEAVHGQLASLCGFLSSEGLEPILVLWKIRYGKGFDDLVEKTGDSYADHLFCIRFGDFEKLYRAASEKTAAETGVRQMRNATKEQRGIYRRCLQKNVEDAAEKAGAKGGNK